MNIKVSVKSNNYSIKNSTESNKINVSVKGNTYNVKSRKTPSKIQVASQSGIIMARKLSDLQDVDLTGVKDKFVLMYDESAEKYRAYNPDEVLSASAVTETTQPGLPQDFIDYLNQNLDLNELGFTDIKELGDEIDGLVQRFNELKLGDLVDVDDSDRKDKYLIMFQELYNGYKAVNPDEVLKATVSEELGGEDEQPGLPEEFIEQLDIDLDNRIDFDGGEY